MPDSIRTYTHSIMLLAAIMATIYVFYQIHTTRRFSRYLALGFAMGLGLLANIITRFFLFVLWLSPCGEALPAKASAIYTSF
ncbi:MAG: hypothetical protein R3E60_00470 [Alphaproteobacteria bacterium]